METKKLVSSKMYKIYILAVTASDGFGEINQRSTDEDWYLS